MVEMNVSDEAGIQSRTQWSNTTSVTLWLLKNISLSRTMVLGPAFSCTRIRPHPSLTSLSLSYPRSDAPVVVVSGASNVWIQGVNMSHPMSPSSFPCTYSLFSPGRDSSLIVCPALYVIRSFAVQITQGSVFGRIDVFRSVHVLLDHLSVTTNFVYEGVNNRTTTASVYRLHGAIRVGEASTGESLLPSNIVISHCEVYGAWELVSLYRGAVGVTVTNNYFHDFLFAAVRCGADVAYVMDCHLVNISNNLIWNPPEYAYGTTDVNNAGVYLCTHWFNPGVYMSCNYIYNQRWCYYLDFTSSGSVIEGGVCNGSYASVKVNGGKFNKASGLVVLWSQRFLTYSTCETLKYANCFQSVGNQWEAARRAYYDTPEINSRYPYMRSICNPIPSAINGRTCNPGGTLVSDTNMTGFCSGFNYGNDLQNFWVYPWRRGAPYDYETCDVDYKIDTRSNNLEVAYSMTSLPEFAGTDASVRVWERGINDTAPFSAIDPNFKACPRDKVGPAPMAPGETLPQFLEFWNLSEPPAFRLVVNLSFRKILDFALRVPREELTVQNVQVTTASVGWRPNPYAVVKGNMRGSLQVRTQ